MDLNSTSQLDTDDSDSEPHLRADLPDILNRLENFIVINVVNAIVDRLGLRNDPYNYGGDGDVARAVSRALRRPHMATTTPMSSVSPETPPSPYEPRRLWRPSVATPSQPTTPFVARLNRNTPTPRPNETPYENRSSRLRREKLLQDRQEGASNHTITRAVSTVTQRRCQPSMPLAVRLNRNTVTLSQPTTPFIARLNRNTPTPRSNETPYENRSSRLRREKLLKDLRASASQSPSRCSSCSSTFTMTAN